jgi:GNAT superfamily N-acetyltransferase
MQSPHTPRTTAIRPAADDDSGQVASLIAACWVAYPGCLLDIQGEEPVLRAIASGFAAKNGRFWVACLGEWVVGSLGLVPGKAKGMAELRKMYVQPRLRRQGLARRLTVLGEAEARIWGCTHMELWSDTRFMEAHAFYHAIGYTQTGAVRELRDLSRSSEYQFSKHLTA